MNDARPIATPLDLDTKLLAGTKTDGEDNQIKSVPIEAYQSAVGSLMYVMLGTRPDIAYAIGLVNQFNHSPRWNHWLAVKRIFRYLGATRDWGLRYGTSNVSGGYSDADWGAGEDRKSVGGFVFLLKGGAISWTSKKQNSIALSTTEAEYMAMTQATKEIGWLRVLLDELGAFAHIEQLSQLHGDNQGALAVARNPEYHARMKHIDIQHHQQKRSLLLIRRRCVLTQATHLLRPMRPVRPDLRCNAPPHPTLPDATWQRSLRPEATWRPPYVWTTPDSFSHRFFLLMRR